MEPPIDETGHKGEVGHLTKKGFLFAFKYHQWLKDNIHPLGNGGYGKCKDLSEKLISDLPWMGLRLVRGHYTCMIWGRRSHWWTEGPDGERVDPTQSQFPSFPIEGVYEEWDDSQPEPVGKCMNCGEHVFEPRYSFCSDGCEALVRSDMGI